MFGKAPRGGDLAAENRQRRRAVEIEIEGVIARHDGGLDRAIIEQRAQSGVAPDNIVPRRGAGKTAVDRRQQIIRFRVADHDRGGGALVGDVGGADQREILLVGIAKTMRLSGFCRI